MVALFFVLIINYYCCPIKKIHDFHIDFTMYCRGYFS